MPALKLFTDDAPRQINQQAELRQCETIIEVGLPAYQNVGAALEKIQLKKLYFPKWPTFQAYVLQRWGISRGEAYKQIKAAKTAAATSESGAAPPPRPAAQALADYSDDPVFQKAVWQRASEEKPKPTAKDIQFHASQLLLEDAAKVAPKVQAKVAAREAQSLEDSARRAATKEEVADQREKALRRAAGLVKLFREMEASGNFGRSLGLAADMEVVLGKVRQWVG